MQSDGSILAGLPDDPKDAAYTCVTNVEAQQIVALRLEMRPDDSLPSRGPGWHETGNFKLQEIEVSTRSDDTELSRIRIAGVAATYSWVDGHVSSAIDDNLQTEWHVFSRTGEPHQAILVLESPISVDAMQQLVTKLYQSHDCPLGRFRLSSISASNLHLGSSTATGQ